MGFIFNSKIFLFVLNLICIFNLNVNRFKTYLFIYSSISRMLFFFFFFFFAMIVYFIVLREQHFGFVPFFFSMPPISAYSWKLVRVWPMRFLRKMWTSGRIDEYNITFWKAPQNSCLGPKRMVFACPRARGYSVRSEVELYSLCQRGVSEVVQPSFRFIKPCFCFQVESSVLAGKQAGTTFKLKMD